MGTSSEVTHPAAPSSSSSLPSEGRDERVGGSRDAPCAASHGASAPPARHVSSERGGSASGRSSGVRERASVSSAPSRAEDPVAARSQRTPVARSALSSVASPHSSLHALRGDESRESSEARSRSRSSCASRSSAREARKDRRARSRSGSSRDRSRRSRSRSASRSRSRASWA